MKNNKVTGIREIEIVNVYDTNIEVTRQGNKKWTIEVTAMDCTCISNYSAGVYDLIISEFVSDGKMEIGEIIYLNIIAKNDELSIWVEKMESDIRVMTNYVAHRVRSTQHMAVMSLKDIIKAKMFEGENDVPGCIIGIDGLTLCLDIDYYEDWTDFNHFELIKRD